MAHNSVTMCDVKKLTPTLLSTDTARTHPQRRPSQDRARQAGQTRDGEWLKGDLACIDTNHKPGRHPLSRLPDSTTSIERIVWSDKYSYLQIRAIRLSPLSPRLTPCKRLSRFYFFFLFLPEQVKRFSARCPAHSRHKNNKQTNKQTTFTINNRMHIL